MASVLVVGKGNPERGGIPTYLHQLVDAEWPEHEVSLLNLTHDGERQGGQVTGGNIKRTLADARRLRRVEGVDIVHLHTALAPLSTLIRASILCLAGRRRGRKILLHAHGGRLVDWSNNARRRRFLALAVRPAHQIAVVSEGLVKTMKDASVRPPVQLVSNGVDISAFQPSSESNTDPDSIPTILFVGHLSRRKGVLDLLEASQRLEAAGVAHHLLLAGGIPDEGDADRDAINQAVTASTELLGPVDPSDMPGMYRTADVFCLPSWWEATPLSVLEAMASGLPIVATSVGDIESMVGDAGWLVSPQQPEALTHALRSALSDVSERRKRGRAARSRAESEHNLAITHARLATMYRELGR